jgi:hypothetical protein
MAMQVCIPGFGRGWGSALGRKNGSFLPQTASSEGHIWRYVAIPAKPNTISAVAAARLVKIADQRSRPRTS